MEPYIKRDDLETDGSARMVFAVVVSLLVPEEYSIDKLKGAAATTNRARGGMAGSDRQASVCLSFGLRYRNLEKQRVPRA